MCGISGIAQPPGEHVSPDVIREMTRALSHRGPDGDGLFVDRHVGLGHRRLSIIDLPGGAQPMFNEDRNIVVVFNGEIFNYRELTNELTARGHVFQTRSDTETLVHLYEEYGLGMLPKLRGMFAFALFDRKLDAVYLVRDRFGIKPMYYWQRGRTLAFASEIRPLTAAGYRVEVNRAGVHQYFRTRFAFGDETIFKGVFRLPAGMCLEWRAGAVRSHRYYPESGAAVTGAESTESQFEDAFADAVNAWMIADVPVGAFLSGGVDSSVIVSEMRRRTDQPIHTFCVDFPGADTEAPAAERMAAHLGCRHQTVRCGVDELLALPRVLASLEEPVGDGVVVAHYVVARAARDAGIKTVMTGDGADETLGGYQHLRAIASLLTWKSRLPIPGLGRIGAAAAARLPLRVVEALADLPLDVTRDARERLASILRLADSGDMRLLYDELLALYRPDELADVYTPEFFDEVSSFARDTLAGDPSGDTLVDRVLSMQFRRWLPANINFKQDRLSMAHGVEARVPFLDHLLVECAAALPPSLKIDGRCTKVALRRIAARRLPREVANAVKTPFHLPLQQMLHDARLWSFVEAHVDDDSVRRRGFVRLDHVARLRREARAGGFLAAKKLFALVILEVWHRVFVDGEPLAA